MRKIILIGLFIILLCRFALADFIVPIACSANGEEGVATCDKTYDNTSAAYWSSALGPATTTNPSIITLQFNASYTLSRMDILAYWGFPSNEVEIQRFNLSYSPDNVTYTLAFDQATDVANSGLIWNHWDLDNGSATYVKFVIYKGGAGATSPRTYEFHFTGVVAPVDTCTAPGIGNWDVDCSDNCNWITAQSVPANMSITGAGHLTLSDVFTFTSLNQYIFIGSGCTLEIKSGGAIQ